MLAKKVFALTLWPEKRIAVDAVRNMTIKWKVFSLSLFPCVPLINEFHLISTLRATLSLANLSAKLIPLEIILKINLPN